MRIVHAVCTDAFAGVERHIATLAAEQADLGNQVLVIGGEPRQTVTAIDREGVRHVPAVGLLEVRRQLNRCRGADVINVHMTEAEMSAALAWRVRDVAVVSTRHFASRRGKSSRLARWAATAGARRIAEQIAVSDYVADHIEGHSVVVRSGVPSVLNITPTRARTPRILVAQRLEQEKRTDLAILAFAASGLAAEGWTLTIAGEGSQRSALARLVADRQLGHAVEFLGYRPDISELMGTSAILLAPRPDEALGLSVLEAAARGLPVVAAAAGGHLETVGTITPELCFPPSDTARAGRILAMLGGDAKARERYANDLVQAQRSRFTVRAQAVATEQVYRSVL